MGTGSIIILSVVIYWLGSYVLRKHREQIRTEGIDDVTVDIGAPRPIRRLTRRLPFAQRVYVDLLSRFSSRNLEPQEMTIRFLEESSEIQVSFYAARKPIRVEVFAPSSSKLQVASLAVSAEEKPQSIRYGIDYAYLGNRLRIRISLSPIVLIDKMQISVDNHEDSFPYEVHVHVDSCQYYDQVIFKEACRSFKIERWEDTLSHCQDYLTDWPRNPFVHYLMAQAYQNIGNLEKAGEHALKSAVHGAGDKGCELYRQTVEPHSFVDLSHIKNLQREYQGWNLETQHGVVTLEKDQKYVLGIDGWYLKRCREILVIRRPVAARMLTRVGFQFSSNDQVLFSSLRIIGKDDHSEELPVEQFTFVDSDEKNPFITTIDERIGCWILPDLSTGDVIEWSYHLLCAERFPADGKKPHLFIRAYLHHAFHPTLLGKATFVSPTDMELSFSYLNDYRGLLEFGSEEDSDRTRSLTLRKYVPATNPDFPYANSFLNPVVGCAVAGHTWESVKQLIIKSNMGSLEPELELPSPLNEILEGRRDPKVAMEYAFYWVRDKLKYAAVGRALKNIGKEGRAKTIIEAGVGDCKDKSYLIYQCCKKLGLAAQYVAISSDTGVIFEDLPADQFNHVFVKVIIDDKTYYLDASSSTAIFSSALPEYQDLKVLLLGDERLVEKIPLDDPYDNLLEITEMFDREEASWLCGSFSLRAQGCLARLVDERWKAMSLQITDQGQSAQSILQMFMPSIVVETHSRTSQTSHSEVFQVSGTHRRCYLSQLGDRRIGTLHWKEPAFPAGMYRFRHPENVFAFYVPEAIRIETVIMNPLLSRFESFSEPVQLSNDVCDIRTESISKNNALTLSREIIIKKKIIGEELIHLMPAVLENLERAMRVALSLRLLN